MDIETLRRQRLKALIDADYGGSKTAFIKKTGINQGELSLLLRYKVFGERRARNLEKAAGVPAMYLDTPDGGPDPLVRLITEQLNLLSKEDIQYVLDLCKLLAKKNSREARVEPTVTVSFENTDRRAAERRNFRNPDERRRSGRRQHNC